MIIPNIWENKIHVPNHQPEISFLQGSWGHGTMRRCIILQLGFRTTAWSISMFSALERAGCLNANRLNELWEIAPSPAHTAWLRVDSHLMMVYLYQKKCMAPVITNRQGCGLKTLKGSKDLWSSPSYPFDERCHHPRTRDTCWNSHAHKHLWLEYT